MTVLQSLAGYYGRMAAFMPPPNYVSQTIGYAAVIDSSGRYITHKVLGAPTKKGFTGVQLNVPKPVTEPSARTSLAIVPYFLWDQPAYLLGIAADDARSAKKYSASRAFHRSMLERAEHPALKAVALFYARYETGLEHSAIPETELNRAFTFQVESKECDSLYPADLPEAASIWMHHLAQASGASGTCLITGRPGPIVRLHPKVGGFKDADSLVSFDKEAFRSWGKEQGVNGPVSLEAAEQYGSALNHLLTSDKRNRVRVGDMTVVFWADASAGEAAAAEAETLTWEMIEPATDAQEAKRLADMLADLAKGRPLADARPRVEPSTRIHVLGLSPNSARLSVRLWLTDRLDELVGRLAAHHHDLALEPLPWRTPPSVGRLMIESTTRELFPKDKPRDLRERLSKMTGHLSGELARAVLTGGPYPRAWLAATIMRLRAGDDPGTGWHAAAIKASIARTPYEETPPVSLEPDNPNSAYQLGRLFAAYENAQRAALGRNVNATIRDRYFGAASATPASVFPLLIRGAQNHLSKVRKEKPGLAVTLEREIEGIVGHLPGTFPRSLRLEEQGRFAIGYYHQRGARFAGVAHDTDEGDDDNDE